MVGAVAEIVVFSISGRCAHDEMTIGINSNAVTLLTLLRRRVIEIHFVGSATLQTVPEIDHLSN